MVIVKRKRYTSNSVKLFLRIYILIMMSFTVKQILYYIKDIDVIVIMYQ